MNRFVGCIVPLCLAVFSLPLLSFFNKKKLSNTKEFLVFNHKLPVCLTTASLLATWFGVGTILGIPGAVAKNGLRAVIADPFGATISLVLAGCFVVAKVRRKKVCTVTDIIDESAGKSAGIFATIWMLPVYIGWLGALLLGFGTVTASITGISIPVAAFCGGIIILIYTINGGMWAVAITDLWQMFMIAIGLMVVCIGVFSLVPFEGVLLNLTIDSGKTSCVVNGVNQYVVTLGDWLMMGLGCTVGQDLLQRSAAAENEKVATVSTLITALAYGIIALIPVLLGIAAKIILGDGINYIEENQILPVMIKNVFSGKSIWINYAWQIALISAILSSADSALLAGVSLFGNNVLRPIIKNRDENFYLNIFRLSMPVFLILSLCIACNARSIYNLMIHSWLAQLAIIWVPVIGSLYLPRAGRFAIWFSLGTSSIAWLVSTVIICAGKNYSCGYGVVFFLNSKFFADSLTAGAVYGFIAGIVAFSIGYYFDVRRYKMENYNDKNFCK